LKCSKVDDGSDEFY